MDELDGFPRPMWMKKEYSKAWMLPTWLPLNQEPSSIYCSQRKSLTLSRKKKKKNFFVVVFAQIVIFSSKRCSFFNYASALLLFVFFCRMSCLISVQERRKKKLLLCASLCVLCRGFTEHSRK